MSKEERVTNLPKKSGEKDVLHENLAEIGEASSKDERSEKNS